ncbi:MAG: outer membrane beta-barrel protein [Leptospirillia bacterium]
MKKSTIAAFAAASLIGFGAVGSANADVEVSGFADIQYNAMNSQGEEGNFRASGEVDIVEAGDMGGIRIDLDLLNVLNTSAAGDVQNTTGQEQVDVEQLHVAVPVNDMITIRAGVANSPFGMEGQDATDIDFTFNGLLWNAVPSNVAGGLADITLNDMASLTVGLLNARTDTAVGGSNDMTAVLSLAPMEGIGLVLGYFSDNTETLGDQIDVVVTASGLVPGLDLAAEYLAGDPLTGSGNFDSGYGINVGYDLGMVLEGLSTDLRYEFSEDEGTGTDETTQTTFAVSLAMSENCVLRAEWNNNNVDLGGTNTTSSDTGTVQLVHSF